MQLTPPLDSEPLGLALAGRSGHGNALLAISAASAVSAREKRNAQRRRERRGPAVGIESAMDGESAPTTHAPNQAAPVNAPVAFWFHAGRAWWRVTEQQRSAATHARYNHYEHSCMGSLGNRRQCVSLRPRTSRQSNPNWRVESPVRADSLGILAL
jgi:hypothetical protein